MCVCLCSLFIVTIKRERQKKTELCYYAFFQLGHLVILFCPLSLLFFSFFSFFRCVILAAFCFVAAAASKNILFILCVCTVAAVLCVPAPSTVPHWLFPSFTYFSFYFFFFSFFVLINLRLFMFSICLQKLFVYFIRQPPPLLATFCLPLPLPLPLSLSISLAWNALFSALNSITKRCCCCFLLYPAKSNFFDYNLPKKRREWMNEGKQRKEIRKSATTKLNVKFNSPHLNEAKKRGEVRRVGQLQLPLLLPPALPSSLSLTLLLLFLSL